MEVWFAPSIVMEVVGAELSVSPLHPAATGAIKEGHGFSLRFPRFIKIRDDKKPEEATSIDELIPMFKAHGHRTVSSDESESRRPEKRNSATAPPRRAARAVARLRSQLGFATFNRSWLDSGERGAPKAYKESSSYREVWASERALHEVRVSGQWGEGVVRGDLSLDQLPLDAFDTDKAFFAALKLHVYGSVHDQFLTTLLGGRSLLLDQALKLEVGRFTSRKANHLFVSENGHRASTSAEFYGFTSHKVREKLTMLHELGVVELLGKGLRDAYTYRWKLPVKHWEVCSFMRFRELTDDDPSLNLELHRVFRSVGMEPFSSKEFLDIYARAHGEEYKSSRWGTRKWEKIASSFEYGEFIKGRLDRLAQHGLVLRKGDELRISPDVADAVNHFDLFLNAVPYRASRSMCEACPLDALCQAGSTQKLIVALNG